VLPHFGRASHSLESKEFRPTSLNAYSFRQLTIISSSFSNPLPQPEHPILLGVLNRLSTTLGDPGLMQKRYLALTVLPVLLLVFCNDRETSASSSSGSSVFSSAMQQRPGLVHKISINDLPLPYATKSADNGPDVVPRPNGVVPQAPSGFKVSLYADGFNNPRLIRTAPNGDVFLAESRNGEIKILRGLDTNGRAQQLSTFATGLRQPFGIAFYPANDPKFVYVGNTDSVVRFPYAAGDLKARGPAEHIVDLPGGGHLRGGGHWTRDIAFSNDGKTMFVSVGSHSNVDDDPEQEFHRADVLAFTPDGKNERVYASGIRNAVGIAVHPQTGQLWVSVNERDELGDNLVPDYITHVEENGFYGWPWFYMGPHQDPRHAGAHPELKSKVITPDVLVQPHFASLEMLFYQGKQFPSQYHGAIFAAEHGSWNKSRPTGYEVIMAPAPGGKASGEYQDFLTGFLTSEGKVWGRPVGVAVMNDGSLLVSDDGSNSVWRVAYSGQ
jgi:glucose/arabinose dehydrogenase